DVRKRGVRPNIEEYPVGGDNAGSSVVRLHFDRFWRHKPAAAHEQFDAGRFVAVKVKRNLAFNHLAFALPHAPHIGRNRAGHGAEVRGLTYEVSDPRAPDFILAWHAGDVGAGAAHPAALDNDGALPRLPHVPSEQLAALAAAKDQTVDLFR